MTTTNVTTRCGNRSLSCDTSCDLDVYAMSCDTSCDLDVYAMWFLLPGAGLDAQGKGRRRGRVVGGQAHQGMHPH